MKTKLPAWDDVFREHIAPRFTLEELRALEAAVEKNDPRLVQGATLLPYTGLDHDKEGVGATDIIACCATTFPGWAAGTRKTRKENIEFIQRLAVEIEAVRPGTFRVFLNWFDETPRIKMLAAFLPVIREVIAARSPQ
jgi:hypothetical protein